MINLFTNLVLGHLLGDYVFQNKWMAVNKGISHFKSFVHVYIYTISILLFTQFNWIWALVIFIPHFVIDRFSLADKWLDLINGRSLKDFIDWGHMGIPTLNEVKIIDKYKRQNYHILRGGFTALVYAVTDNTFHLFCLWYGYKLVFGT